MQRHSLEHAHRRGYPAMQFNFDISTNARGAALGDVDALVMFQPLPAVEPG
jgi:hypothetical protein